MNPFSGSEIFTVSVPKVPGAAVASSDSGQGGGDFFAILEDGTTAVSPEHPAKQGADIAELPASAASGVAAIWQQILTTAKHDPHQRAAEQIAARPQRGTAALAAPQALVLGRIPAETGALVPEALPAGTGQTAPSSKILKPADNGAEAATPYPAAAPQYAASGGALGALASVAGSAVSTNEPAALGTPVAPAASGSAVAPSAENAQNRPLAEAPHARNPSASSPLPAPASLRLDAVPQAAPVTRTGAAASADAGGAAPAVTTYLKTAAPARDVASRPPAGPFFAASSAAATMAAPQEIFRKAVIAPAGAESAAREHAVVRARMVGAGHESGAGKTAAPAPAVASKIAVPGWSGGLHGAALRALAGPEDSGSAPKNLMSAAVARGPSSVTPTTGAPADFVDAEHHSIVPNARPTFIPRAMPETDAGLAESGAPLPAPVQLRNPESGALPETTPGPVRTKLASPPVARTERVQPSDIPGGGEPRDRMPPQIPVAGKTATNTRARYAPVPEAPDRAVTFVTVPTREPVMAGPALAGLGHPEPEPSAQVDPEQRFGVPPPVAMYSAGEIASKAALTRSATLNTAPATETGASAPEGEPTQPVAVQTPAAQPRGAAAPPPSPADTAEFAVQARPRAPDATEPQVLPESLLAPGHIAPPPLAGTAPAAELGPAISRQIAQIASHAPDGPVELTLSPEELGRVRLTLATTDSGISVSVQAERPETLDLIRRNIEHLARDFRDLGYSSTAFTFGDRPHNGQADTQPRAQAPQPVPELFQPLNALQSGSPATTGPAPVAAGGLDLRL